MPTRIIFDTDIGTDVDDCVALALILGSPELKLEGVTCVYGDVLLRARMVRKLLRLRGISDTPVLAGVSKPLLGLRPVYWPGHEGVGLLEPEDDALQPDPEHAVDFMIRTVMENPGELHLVAVGPLTNVALAFLREPRMAEQLAHVTIMGGAIRGPGKLGLPYGEHNIRCDPEAAHIVFSSGAPITLIPLDVTTQVSIRKADVERVRNAGTPFHTAVADQVALYPRFKERGATTMHDPLAVAVVVQPDLVRLEPLRVDVELDGRHTAGATLARIPTGDAPANMGVALEVEAGRFEALLGERLAS